MFIASFTVLRQEVLIRKLNSFLSSSCLTFGRGCFISPINGNIGVWQGNQDPNAEVEEVAKAISSSFNNLDLVVRAFNGAIRVMIIFETGNNLLAVNS